MNRSLPPSSTSIVPPRKPLSPKTVNEAEITQFPKRQLTVAKMHMAFSTAAKATKEITWTFKGTTKNMNTAVTGINEGVGGVPGLLGSLKVYRD